MAHRFASMAGLAAAFLIALLCHTAVSPLAAGEASLPEPRTAIQESLRSLGLQTKLPGVETGEKSERWCDGGGHSAAPSSSMSAVADSTATFMLWVAVAVFVLVLLVTLADNLRLDRRRGGRVDPDDSGDSGHAAVRERMATARGDADALAERENYADAMHVLLLQGLNEMRRRLNLSFASSLTSREILRRTRLEPHAHEALSDIISRVEISYFGTHLPSRDDYLACRRSYATLTGILQQGGAA